MNYKTNPEILRKVQMVQLEMLLELDRICRENNIKYQLCDGTLLGAVRHKGFIPWDDDIDVAMLREDYNKFLDICRLELNDKYYIQNFETEKCLVANITGIRKNYTLQLMNMYSEIDIHHGIWIDIFPYDNVLPNKLLGKFQLFLLYIIKIIKPRKIKKRVLSSKKKTAKYLGIIIHYILKPISIKKINIIQNNINCIFSNKETPYSACLASGFPNSFKGTLRKNDSFNNTVNIEFEGHLFPAPRNYDEILRNQYGNYMKLPSMQDRKSHHDVTDVEIYTKHKRGVEKFIL